MVIDSLRIILGTALVLVLAAPPGRADTLDAIRQRGTLRWGGDQEGGGPYIYPAPDDPNRTIGFEVDLMRLLAERLDVRPEFHQGEWDKLPDLLRRGDVDIVLNGYELTPERLDALSASFPYYVYELQLLARKDDPSIRSWEDLKTGANKRRIGVLQGSAAEAYVKKRLGDSVEVRSYPGNTDALMEVQNGRLDATLQDLPIAIFYRERFAGLRPVDAPVAPGHYVIYLRKNDDRLRDALNKALVELFHSGQLRALYERYGLWNSSQEQLGTLYRVVVPGSHPDDRAPGPGGTDAEVVHSTQQRGWSAVERNLPILLQATGMTVLLTCLSMPLAVVVGLSVALGRLYGPAPLRGLLAGYVEVLRGTPLLIQLFTIYYVLPPALGINLDPIPAAILGLAINYSAYEAEIYRAGLMAIPVGQMEAALSLGMSRAVALRRVIVPQAVRLVIPPVTNDFIALFKDTSICSVITVVELSKRYSILVNSTSAYIELMVVTALLYLMMSYPLSLLARRLEKKYPNAVA